MASRFETSIQEGIRHTATRNGAILIGAVMVLTIVEILLGVLTDLISNSEGVTITSESLSSTGFPITTYSLSGVGGQLMSEGTGVSLSVQFGVLSITLADVTSLVMTFIWAAFWVIGTRVFVSEHTDTIPREFVRHNIGFATLNVVIGGIVVSWLITIGFVLLIIPGIIIWICMLLVGHEIAVADENVIGAIPNSWRLMRPFIITILILGIVLAILFFMLSPALFLSGAILIGVLTSLPLWLAVALTILINAVTMVLGIAIAARWYAQVRRSYIRKHWTLSAEPTTTNP